tara:strand:+ start:1239 stop:1931 length:693 start_codon:yes stop_codon:yes gene_type:complete
MPRAKSTVSKPARRPTDALAQLAPRFGTDRRHNPSQFYRTPCAAPMALLNVEGRRIRSVSRRVQECASGEGDLVRVLAAYDFDVVASDIRRGPEICGQGGVDFLKSKRLRAPVIITNPPFAEVAEKFIRHAKKLKALYLALLLPSGFFQSAAANIRCFLDHPPTRIWPLGFRLDFTGAGKALPNAFSWFVWDWSGIERGHHEYPASRVFARPVSVLMPALAKPKHMVVPQ